MTNAGQQRFFLLMDRVRKSAFKVPRSSALSGAEADRAIKGMTHLPLPLQKANRKAISWRTQATRVLGTGTRPQKPVGLAGAATT